ncbi:hypothetical protein [Lacipirellula sp.]|uniref:hypothetical protein n=1 Tax=Lacipirellula sp. TaxID=2691419 RepID=UPI003D0F1D32
MSQPNFESDSPAPTVLTKKSAWNIYTALLLISLVALMLASLFFLLEINTYGFGTQKGPLSMSVPAPANAAASLWT